MSTEGCRVCITYQESVSPEAARSVKGCLGSVALFLNLMKYVLLLIDCSPKILGQKSAVAESFISIPRKKDDFWCVCLAR